MPCREISHKRLRLCNAACGTYILAAAAALSLAGCGGQLVNFEPPQRNGTNEKPRQSTDGDTPDRHIFCPEVLILEGTEVSRAYAGAPPSSANLRYQFAVTDTARECKL